MPKPVSDLWREAAENWVILEAAANILEETKSSVLSQMMVEKGDIPVSRAEMQVKASPEWDRHIHSIADARTKANKAKVLVDYYKMRHHEEMSRQATDRLEAKL